MARSILANRLYKTVYDVKFPAHLHSLNVEKASYKLDNVLKKWKQAFIENNISEPESSVNNIIAYVLNIRKISDIYINVNRFMSMKQIDEITKMCEMRLKNKPIQYVIGEWDFKGFTLKMREPVFIPRPETEQLVDLTLSECDENVTEVLELGCGSGAVSLALLKANPRLKMTAVDKSKQACELTKENAKAHNVLNRMEVIEKAITQRNVTNFLCKQFKVIACNPPYLSTRDLNHLQPEIKLYEDLDALHGGGDGLRLIKLVLRASSHLLEAGGKVILEVDRWHPNSVKAYLAENPALGLSITAIHRDIYNKDRFITVKKR